MNTPARSRRRARSPARRNLEGARSMHFRRLEAITRARNVPLMLAALTAASALLAAPAAHAAFLPLPATGAQVNDDPVNSIDPSEDAGVADVAGGSLTAGKVQVPWATFEQRVAGGGQHIFVRAFKNGAWVTQGFPASLNIDPTEEAEAPSIDFAGAGRVVRAARNPRMADEHLRQPFQRGGQSLAALRPGPRRPPPVPQHP